MSKIAIRIPVPLRPFVDDAAVMDADADTVGAALGQIGARHPGFLQRIIVSDGELRPYVNVFVGTDDVRSHGGLKTPLHDGDVVRIISAVAGG